MTFAVYAIRVVGTNEVKIGAARRPEFRLSQLQVANSRRLSLESFAFLPSKTEAYAFEAWLHERLAGNLLVGEWFGLASTVTLTPNSIILGDVAIAYDGYPAYDHVLNDDLRELKNPHGYNVTDRDYKRIVAASAKAGKRPATWVREAVLSVLREEEATAQNLRDMQETQEEPAPLSPLPNPKAA